MTSWQTARDIMGKNFFGYREASRHLGTNPSQQQYLRMASVSFEDTSLVTRRDTHLLVAVLPCSILDLRQRVGHLFGDDAKDPWYANQAFAQRRGEFPDWYLIRKAPINASSQVSEARHFVTDEGEGGGLDARIVAYAAIGHFLETGERLFGTGIRCVADFASSTYIKIGLGDGGLEISSTKIVTHRRITTRDASPVLQELQA